MKRITFILLAGLFLTSYSLKAEINQTAPGVLSELDIFMISHEQLIKYSASDFIESIHEEELNYFMEITEEFLKYNPTNFEYKNDEFINDNFEALIEMSLKYKAPSEDTSEILINDNDSLTDYINSTIASLKYQAPFEKEINNNGYNFNNELACK